MEKGAKEKFMLLRLSRAIFSAGTNSFLFFSFSSWFMRVEYLKCVSIQSRKAEKYWKANKIQLRWLDSIRMKINRNAICLHRFLSEWVCQLAWLLLSARDGNQQSQWDKQEVGRVEVKGKYMIEAGWIVLRNKSLICVDDTWLGIGSWLWQCKTDAMILSKRLTLLGVILEWWKTQTRRSAWIFNPNFVTVTVGKTVFYAPVEEVFFCHPTL